LRENPSKELAAESNELLQQEIKAYDTQTIIELKEFLMNDWLLPAFGALFCWGFWSFIPKITIRYLHPMSAMVYEALGAAIAGFSILAILGFHPESNPKGIGLAILTGVLGMVGALGFYYAVKYGKVSVVAVLTAMYPIVPIFLGYFLLKEPITLKEGLGILFAFVALILFAS